MCLHQETDSYFHANFWSEWSLVKEPCSGTLYSADW